MVPDPDGYEAAERSTRTARANVAAQLTDLLMTSERAGSRELVALRVQAVTEAERIGDRAVCRHARMEAAVAFALWAVAADTSGPQGA
ncbi:MAG: hypothetical protein LC798_12995 [Chloroflexi bacterium]|nr:hypothetical protein [Chloroflexota bacterium]